MPSTHGSTLLPLLAVIGSLGCGGGDANQPPKTAADSAKQVIGGLVGGLMKMAQKQESLDQTNPYAKLKDPCTLVSRTEAEKYLGPLAADPYRVSNAEPSRSGRTCLYRGANGRSITIDPDFTGGRMGMKIITGMGGMVNQALVTESGAADTLEGDWDDVRWTFGQLMALKGNAMITVDVTSSNAGPPGAADLANIAIHRLDHPLDYDGSAAVAHAPGPLVTPKDPCSLVTAAEAAAILGPLKGDPKSDSHGCVYTVASRLGGGTAPVALQVTWTGGFKAMNEAKQSTRLVNQSFIEPTLAGAGAEKAEADMQKDSASREFVEKMRGVMKAMGGPTTNEGSLTTFKTDTTSLKGKGPWDEAAILNGFTFMAVKKDVVIAVDLRGLDEQQAEALVAKAMGRI